MAEAATETAHKSDELARESRRAEGDRRRGATALSIVGSGRAQRILHLAEAMAKVLLASSATLRKALVGQLKEEGTGVSAISRLFGVSHQRISTLLRKQGAKEKR